MRKVLFYGKFQPCRSDKFSDSGVRLLEAEGDGFVRWLLRNASFPRVLVETVVRVPKIAQIKVAIEMEIAVHVSLMTDAATLMGLKRTANKIYFDRDTPMTTAVGCASVCAATECGSRARRRPAQIRARRTVWGSRATSPAGDKMLSSSRMSVEKKPATRHASA